MDRFRTLLGLGLVAVLVCLCTTGVRAQTPPLSVFGYFQNEFYQDDEDGIARNTFLLQQLNLFLQRDFGRRWTSFVNLEIVNTYSSQRNWGGMSIEEAWVRYRFDARLQVKMGLQIPDFNNLNLIKNRTPLLPYIIRPFVYETSFQEFFNQEVTVPQRVFAQAYGAFPVGEWRVDYALFLGNGPNISSVFDSLSQQTGVDTTDNLMYGGRVGIRYKELKAGVSGTRELTNEFFDLGKILALPEGSTEEIPLQRIGADASYRIRGFLIETELISARMERDLLEGVETEIFFYYVTVGVSPVERLLIYATLSELDITGPAYYPPSPRPGSEVIPAEERIDVDLPTIGAVYHINDRVVVKAQYLEADIKNVTTPLKRDKHAVFTNDINRFALAVSVFF